MTNPNSTNRVLHASSNQFYWEGQGQLSLKSFRNGRAHYKTNKGFFAVEEGSYLLLNQGSYTISIDEQVEIESFCLFFKDGFAEEIYSTMIKSTDKLLSEPYKETNAIEFFEKTYPTNPKLALQLTVFKQGLTDLEKGSIGYEEHFHQIMQSVVSSHIEILKEVDTLSSIRYSTREELYRRVSIAHDYIRAFYDKSIQLNEIAQVACLSPNHLLRSYQQIYGVTPHQHISQYRVHRAKQLLAQLDFSMTDITFELGFHSPASFSKMFKQHVGISPLGFRKKVILDKKR